MTEQNLDRISPVWSRSATIVADYGEGIYLVDVNGNRYIDFTSGSVSPVALPTRQAASAAARPSAEVMSPATARGASTRAPNRRTTRARSRTGRRAQARVGGRHQPRGGATPGQLTLSSLGLRPRRPWVRAEAVLMRPIPVSPRTLLLPSLVLPISM